ncbi:hypothetical protein [Natrarchaeobius oligotrophus]|uniref:DUF8163 domain-containing protein n=1 Tax=Natrarchaeobius chitinivorans TaxID=1679083 RepID=A0A3N6MJ39_NATCH|nr:hypothetical protein [Natrarchaeobius chitinivorans]RQH01235.1 hypothetical protein EA472_07210 [Natrarchaeobius chitinivorans]
MSTEFDGGERDESAIPDRSVLDVGALIVVGAGLWIVAGPIGGVVALVTAGLWYAFGTPYALAAGFVGLSTIAPLSASEPELAWIPLGGYGLLLLTAGYRTATPRRFAVAASVTVPVLALVGWVVATAITDALWAVGVSILAWSAVVVAAIRRYGRREVKRKTAATPARDTAGDSTPRGGSDYDHD